MICKFAFYFQGEFLKKQKQNKTKKTLAVLIVKILLAMILRNNKRMRMLQTNQSGRLHHQNIQTDHTAQYPKIELKNGWKI